MQSTSAFIQHWLGHMAKSRLTRDKQRVIEGETEWGIGYITLSQTDCKREILIKS